MWMPRDWVVCLKQDGECIIFEVEAAGIPRMKSAGSYKVKKRALYDAKRALKAIAWQKLIEWSSLERVHMAIDGSGYSLCGLPVHPAFLSCKKVSRCLTCDKVFRLNRVHPFFAKLVIAAS